MAKCRTSIVKRPNARQIKKPMKHPTEKKGRNCGGKAWTNEKAVSRNGQRLLTNEKAESEKSKKLEKNDIINNQLYSLLCQYSPFLGPRAKAPKVG